jgi:predicted  nucleic acid-binding Zn-ribbon protein
VSTLAGLVQLGDLDLLAHELERSDSRQRLRKLGFSLDGIPRLAAVREKVARAIDPRWVTAYERARHRYGRGIAAVRERVCLGCFVTLPTSAARPSGESAGGEVTGAPGMCASCARVLYWS